jgi:hypothetical protein
MSGAASEVPVSSVSAAAGWAWHDQGAVLLGGDLDDGLQQPQGRRVGGHDGGGLR